MHVHGEQGHIKMKTINKKARFNYNLFERFETGIVLVGAEVKAIRKGGINLNNSYAKIIEKEVYLINASIPVEGKKNYDPSRARKLLMHKKEILSLQTKVQAKRLTLVPVSVYTKRGLVKIGIALAKSKREFQKKELKKRRDIERDIERELRGEKDNKSRI